MVDRSDLSKINDLYREYNQIAKALDSLDAGGKIIDMTIADPDGSTVGVSTREISYPEQMVAAIKQRLIDREQHISDELTGLGVSGVHASR